MNALLRVAGLTVRFGTTVVLHDLDLTVQRNEMFVLLGGSGSGKTTLLRAIAGFAQTAAGHIELDGETLDGKPPHRRPVNTMFQSYALFPHMSIAANIAFGLRQQGRSRAEIAKRVAEMLVLVRLEGLAERRPDQLSGGQQQRVALARSLAPNPALLLLDEPLSALDRGLRAETRAELVRLRRQVGTSFILVTHDQEEAMTMADRIGVMHEGHMAQVGTPAEVYERPNSRFVAEFLGAANILSGVLRADGTTVDLPSLAASVITAPGGSPGPLQIAIRPERVRLHPSDEPNGLRAVVIASAYAGETISFTVRLSDGTQFRASQSLRDGIRADLPAIGDDVTVSWSRDAGILLLP